MPYAPENYHLHLAAVKRYEKSTKGRVTRSLRDARAKEKLLALQAEMRQEAQEARRRADPWFGVDFSK